MRIEEVRKLIKLVEESDIGELDVWKWWGRIRISKNSPVTGNGTVQVSASAPLPERRVVDTPAAAEPKAADDTAGLTPIKSPMVGTFYRTPAPDADPYVEPGDVIEVGQTICIIEAMKLMNEIQAETRGKVVKVVAVNGQPVEFGQTLLLIDES